MSKNFYFKLSLLILSLAFINSTKLYAQGEQLITEAQVEEYKKRKPKIAERAGIRASLKALRNNGALQRAIRIRANRDAQRRANRVAQRTTQATTDETTGNAASEEEIVAIKHVLTCDSLADCETANEWGNNNNFDASGVLISHGHGGEIMYHLFLRQEVSPDEDTITAQTSKVHEGVKTLNGISYATWMIDFDPSGEQDVEANQ